MPATAYRAYGDARIRLSADGRSRIVPWIVHGTSDIDEAADLLVATSPTSESGLVRSEIGDLRMLGMESWETDIVYSPFVGGLPDPGTAGIEGRDSTFQFETGGGRRTLRTNLATMGVHVKSGGTAPASNLLRLINATPETGVEGVEIEASVFAFSITKSFSAAELPNSYAQRLYRLTNKVNSIPVTLSAGGLSMTFAAGELLFKGGSGAIDNNDGRWRFTYSFSASPNTTVQLEGFADFQVKGWEYLEIRSVGKTTGTGDSIIPIREPYAAIVHAVYFLDDLNDLGV
jgi:hypothetical protein